ncbi:MAG: sialidase family protein [Candidatus Hydrogenedentota bacterium]
MHRLLKLRTFPALALATLLITAAAAQDDRRNIRNGYDIPSENYADQPYVVVRDDGAWVCTLTTGTGHEGKPGQHVVATISEDKGKTWSPLIDIEPADGPEASWVVPFITPDGRIYGFYSYNGDRLEPRADMLGWYCYRYSDDGGKTWSERGRLPMRVTAADRGNDWDGEHQIFWGICKPIASGDDVFWAFTKLGKYMLDLGEGWVYRSNNLLTETDPEKLHWELLPEGDHGIRHPDFGSVQEEHNIVALDNGGLFCMYRTTQGFPAQSYSRNRGKNWSLPEPAVYRPGGRQFKHPRACPRIWKVRHGHYLFWFHNHGGTTYKERNPVWISGGIEHDGRIHWSEPEILLYDPDIDIRMSYPDLIVEDSRYFFTETQKKMARVHEAEPMRIEGLWKQFDIAERAAGGIVLADGSAAPAIPRLDANGGFTIEVADVQPREAGTVLFSTAGPSGRGVTLTHAEGGALRMAFSDGTHEASWASDPLPQDEAVDVAVIVDGGPDVIVFVVDARVCDGGEARQYGWGRFPRAMGDVTGAGLCDVAANAAIWFYPRAITVTEAIGNHRAAM